MKRNYITPNTEMINLGSNGIMQDALSIITGSGAPTVDNAMDID